MTDPVVPAERQASGDQPQPDAAAERERWQPYPSAATVRRRYYGMDVSASTAAGPAMASTDRGSCSPPASGPSFSRPAVYA